MTEAVTILRCASCGKPFSYIPQEADLCAPGTKSQICDACAQEMVEGFERDDWLWKHLYEK